MKQTIENIINKNLPEKGIKWMQEGNYSHKDRKGYTDGYNQALSQINTSLIADEVLKVVEKDKAIDYLLRIQGWAEQFEKDNSSVDIRWLNDILKEYFHLSPN